MPLEEPEPSLPIKLNEVSWYSRLLAIVLFIGVIPALFFYIGVHYEAVLQAAPINPSSGEFSPHEPVVSQTASSAQTSQLIVGTWQSTDDPNDSVTFSSDGTWKESYQGDSSDKGSGSWTVLPNLSEENLPPELASFKTIAGPFLKEVYEGEPLYFSILNVDTESLSLDYLGRGNTLSYTRVK